MKPIATLKPAANLIISCSTIGGIRFGTPPELFLTDQIRTLVHVRDCGFDHVELIYSDEPDWVGKTIESALQDFALKPYSIHLPKFVMSQDEQEFKQVTSAVFAFAAKLGIGVAVLHPPGPPELYGTQWLTRFDRLLELSEETHCSLTLENMPYIPNVDEFLLDIIRTHEMTSLGVTIDLEYMRFHGSQMTDIVEKFGHRLLNVHFRDGDGKLIDADGRRRYLLPGTGDINLLETLRALHRAGYDKAITVEVSHRQRDNIVKAKAFLDDCLRML